MKTAKFITIITACAVMVACKKKEDPAPFSPTNVTGTTTVKGNVNKNVITPDGSGGWTNGSTARIPAQGVVVSITVSKSSLYPNSNAQGADVYTATTDANGNFSIPVKSNANGVAASITIEGFTGTLDTLVNGQTKTGLSAVFEGTNMNRTLVMGQTAQVDYSFDSRNVASNPNSLQTGTATITGSVSVSLVEQNSGNPINVAAPAGHKVYLRLSNDPATGSPKTYETTTDAQGVYRFDVATVAMNTPGFSQNAQIWINDFATTRDTLKSDNTRITGRAGVYRMSTISETGLFNNTIRNAAYIRYTTFVQN